MTSKPSIGLCAIIRDISRKDRKLRFEKTLEQIMPHMDQVVIGISDQTQDESENIVREIIEKANIPNSIYITKWNHDFSDQLNTLIEKSETDWIVRLHQDRRYSLEDLPELRTIIDLAEDTGKSVIRVRELHYHDRKTRSRPEFILKSNRRFVGIHCENLVKIPEQETGNIDDHCITPEDVLFSEVVLLHETLPGEEKTTTQYRKRLTEQELLRLSVQRDNATTAAEHYLLATRYFILAISQQTNTLGEAYRQAKIASEIEPDNPSPSILIGDCQRKMGHYHLAQSYYETGMEKGSSVAKERIERMLISAKR